jgi:hypothetical protein
MLSTDNLGAGGRLSNQAIAYMSLVGLADKHKQELVLPAEWKYKKYFNLPDHSGQSKGVVIREKEFHYTEYPELKTGDWRLHGYFQSYKYWKHCEKKVLNIFKWNESEFKHLPKVNKKSIAIHIRRGDYVGNSSYAQLSISYYINALFTHFPDWQKREINIYSDDPDYCKLHFGSWTNIRIHHNADIEDLYLMSQSENIILSNSSYSWLGAYLGVKKKVIRPVHHFAGNLAHLSTKDFWIPEWIAFEESEKIDLTDVTFTIPVFYDHPDRRKNLDLSVCMLQHYFDTNIIVNENKTTLMAHMAQYTDYFYTDHPVFHRTKMLNEMAKRAKTKYIFNWDADIIIAPMQILKAVELLRSGVDMVYPYDGTFARVNRIPYFKQIEKSMDVGTIKGIKFKGMEDPAVQSVGGAVGWNLKSYFEAGGENERFISFGAEDSERFERAKKLGYSVERVKGALYHLDHWVGVNSSTRNPYFMQNRVEYERVKSMSKKELKEYIKSWK